MHPYHLIIHTPPLAKINFSYSILFHLTTSYFSYFGGKKGISRNKTSFFLLMACCCAPCTHPFVNHICSGSRWESDRHCIELRRGCLIGLRNIGVCIYDVCPSAPGPLISYLIYGQSMVCLIWTSVILSGPFLPRLHIPYRTVSLNTPLQIVIIPISDTCCLCFGHGKAFVRTLAVCWFPQQLMAETLPHFIICLIECHLISICLACWWN